MGVRGSRQKQGRKAPSYLCRPTQLRFVAARGDLFVTQKGMGMQSALLLVPSNSTSFHRSTGDFVSPQRCVFIVPPDSTAFRRGTGGFICQRFGQKGLRGASRYSRYNPVNWQHGKSCLPAIRTTQREQAGIRDCNNLHRVWGPHWADRRSESGRMLQNRRRSEK